MKNHLVYYESFGCQMNAFDTETISSMLSGYGFGQASSPGESDVIIVNTCSVREHAETRAIGRLTDLSRHRDSLLVVCGCMAQRLGEKLFELVPGISIISGTDTYERLPAAISETLKSKGRTVMLERDGLVTYSLRPGGVSGAPSKYLSVTRGCNNYCSYCVVPYLRGEVRSKDPNVIIEEINSMVEHGTKEVTLLGQNVMAYRYGNVDFHALLRRVVNETDLKRVRFLTSHPRDMDERVLLMTATEESICPHIHLPFQSGSDRILGIMKRGYTHREYLGIVKRGRDISPGLAVTTDIIVGFPTETESDFKDTLDLVDEVRFDAAFTFKYSVREGTKAAEFNDNVPAEVKKERLHILNSRIREIRSEILHDQLGSKTEILLDGRVKKGEYLFWKGRTPHYRNVFVLGDHLKEGDIVHVRLKSMLNFTFVGEELARR